MRRWLAARRGAAPADQDARQSPARRRNQLRLRHRRDWWHPFDETMATGWPTVLRGRIARRADELTRAMDHAGGVYFPKRLHGVRVAAKKLRYTAPNWPARAACRDARRP